ncbi:MAG TPA: RES domain-containing protein, partial [Opitutaceae bacterium]|nr:RES domain-containing protein [Opitutaceae bacterium]
MTDLRKKRIAPPPPGFKDAAIPTFTEARLKAGALAAATWTRLHEVAYPNQFYPSLRSRLTPASGAFPCVYLAPSPETAVAEIWGDQLAGEKGRGEDVFVIPRKKADAYGYLLADSIPPLRLCDFTHGETLLAIGLDLATLYSPDLSVPQRWAEWIVRHPAGFDG